MLGIKKEGIPSFFDINLPTLIQIIAWRKKNKSGA